MRNLLYALALATVIPFAAGTTGCNKSSDAPSCDKVAVHFLELAPDQFKKTITKKDLVDSCKKKKLTPEQRTCAVAAKDFQSLAACEHKGKKKAG